MNQKVTDSPQSLGKRNASQELKNRMLFNQTTILIFISYVFSETKRCKSNRNNLEKLKHDLHTKEPKIT